MNGAREGLKTPLTFVEKILTFSGTFLNSCLLTLFLINFLVGVSLFAKKLVDLLIFVLYFLTLSLPLTCSILML